MSNVKNKEEVLYDNRLFIVESRCGSFGGTKYTIVAKDNPKESACVLRHDFKRRRNRELPVLAAAFDALFESKTMNDARKADYMSRFCANLILNYADAVPQMCGGFYWYKSNAEKLECFKTWITEFLPKYLKSVEESNSKVKKEESKEPPRGGLYKIPEN
jgi:hypothetical protein